MTATLTPHFVLTDDELQVIASRIGVQALPVVLGLRPRHGTETALLAAVDIATRSLSERGLIRDGEVAPELVPLLRALQRPDRELAMRVVTPEGTARVTVVRKGVQCISARRVGNEITVDVIEGAPNPVRGRRLTAASSSCVVCCRRKSGRCAAGCGQSSAVRHP